MSQQNSLLSVEYTCRLKLLPIKETPAYRVAANADDCNLGELLAVMIGGNDQLEVAERLVGKFGSLKRLAQAHPEEIAAVHGVGKQKALRLKAAIALGRKLLQPEEERLAIRSPSDAAAIVSPILAHRDQEYLVVLVLDTRNRVIDTVEIYRGSLNSSMVRVAELFKPAIQRNAAAIILSHNHPSGDPTPSPEDVSLCFQHYISRASDFKCAWAEGWADFLPLAVNNDQCYNYSNDKCKGTADQDYYNLELHSRIDNWNDFNWGESVEGRVAGALYDLYDSNNEGMDQIFRGITPIANYALGNPPIQTFQDFWNLWKVNEPDTFLSGLTLYWNTIMVININQIYLPRVNK